MNAPGSPSSPLQMMYLVSPGEAAANFHLVPGREPGASAAAQAGGEDLLDDLLRLHGREGLARGLVAAARQVLVQALRVDHADVPEGDAMLRLVEGDVARAGDALAGGGIHIQELLHDLTAREVLLDDRLDVLELEPRVVRVALGDDRERSLRAQAVAADDAHLDLVLQAGGGDLCLELVADLHGAGEHAGGAGADTHAAPAVRAGGHLDLDALGGHGGGLRHRRHLPAPPPPAQAACARPCASRRR